MKIKLQKKLAKPSIKLRKRAPAATLDAWFQQRLKRVFRDAIKLHGPEWEMIVNALQGSPSSAYCRCLRDARKMKALDVARHNLAAKVIRLLCGNDKEY